MGDAASPALALRDLRRARHHRHRDDVDWVETLYRVYVTVLSAVAVIWLSVSKVTDASAKGGGLAHIRDHGAAILGLVVAYLVALGLRSGSRGGPLSLEAADVRVVLLAPISRRLALRAPALLQVRSAAFGSKRTSVRISSASSSVGSGDVSPAATRNVAGKSPRSSTALRSASVARARTTAARY